MIWKTRPGKGTLATVFLCLLAACVTTKAVVRPDNCAQRFTAHENAKEDYARKRATYEACEKEKCPNVYAAGTVAEVYRCWYATCADQWWQKDTAQQALVEIYKNYMPCLGLESRE